MQTILVPSLRDGTDPSAPAKEDAPATVAFDATLAEKVQQRSRPNAPAVPTVQPRAGERPRPAYQFD
jgi:hypothetical protein